MATNCEEICEEFEKHRPPSTIHGWKMMKRRWEMDPSQPDPYLVVEKGRSSIRTD
jgi:hypothetical protein